MIDCKMHRHTSSEPLLAVTSSSLAAHSQELMHVERDAKGLGQGFAQSAVIRHEAAALAKCRGGEHTSWMAVACRTVSFLACTCQVDSCIWGSSGTGAADCPHVRTLCALFSCKKRLQAAPDSRHKCGQGQTEMYFR